MQRGSMPLCVHHAYLPTHVPAYLHAKLGLVLSAFGGCPSLAAAQPPARVPLPPSRRLASEDDQEQAVGMEAEEQHVWDHDVAMSDARR